MNCKPGDLAIVIGAATPGLDGTIVEVLRPRVTGEIFKGNPRAFKATGDILSWVCKAASGRPLPWSSPSSGLISMFDERPIADSILKPIRDADGEDETLAWAGKPQGVKAWGPTPSFDGDGLRSIPIHSVVATTGATFLLSWCGWNGKA